MSDRTACQPTEAAIAAAYVMDRAQQYKASSGSYHALCVLAEELARGEHLAAWKHGELDDLVKLTEEGEDATTQG